MQNNIHTLSLFPDIEPSAGGSPAAPAPRKTRRQKFEDYDGFVEKYKPKKTTDDCLTPQAVYEAVRGWVNDNILPLNGVPVVRPFWPGGDFENFDYPEGCVVIDNPPFSILARIRRFYHARGIRYFLFAPSLTLANGARELPATYIICGTGIIYENGARVSTSFVTNLDCGDTAIWVAGDLAGLIEDANACRERAKPLPAYEYPANVTSAALLQKISKRGMVLRIRRGHCVPVKGIDTQREHGKAIYGGGWLLSDAAAAEKAAAEKAAAEKAAAEKAAAEKAAAIQRRFWPLSERERAIIDAMGADGPGD